MIVVADNVFDVFTDLVTSFFLTHFWQRQILDKCVLVRILIVLFHISAPLINDWNSFVPPQSAGH